jgi:hypothetical protein
VTDKTFDQLTKLVSKTTTRRGVLKGAAAAAMGGIAMRLRGNSADARARVAMACARLGQPCNVTKHTPGGLVCCPHLACDSDHVCCSPTNTSCMGDTDCCGSDVCRPNPSGLGNRCLPPGDVGAECIEDTDCMGGLACEVLSGQCGVICGLETCRPDQTCDPYTLTCLGCLDEGSECLTIDDCCGKLVCAPDVLLGTAQETYCVQCLVNGAACSDPRQCCGLICSQGQCTNIH